MSMFDTRKLTHEELRRYEFLMRDVPSLSDSQRAELRFLLDKMTASRPVVQSSPSVQAVEAEPLPTSVVSDDSVSSGVSRSSARTRRPRSKRPLFGGLGRLLGIAFLCLCAWFLYSYLSAPIGGSRLSDTLPESYQSFSAEKLELGTNILLVGTDARPSGDSDSIRTDTIMVLNVGSGDPTLVSFMRDTLVTIPGVSGTHKLNAAFSYGGVDKVRETLKTNFGIPIEHYVMVDFETFVRAVDALFPSGIEVETDFGTVNGFVPDYVDVPDDLGFASGGKPYQRITNKRQTMDGKTLLNYARFRGADDNDAGRVRRQQQVLGILSDHALSLGTLLNSPAAVRTVYELTDTSLSLGDLVSLLKFFLAGSVSRVSVPEPGDWDDAWDSDGGLGLDIDRDHYRGILFDYGLLDDYLE